LPNARAFVGTYWFFGPGDLPGDVVILHGFHEDDFSNFCGSVTAAGYVTHSHAVTEQRDLTVYLCREATVIELFNRELSGTEIAAIHVVDPEGKCKLPINP
jgi:hypothetical protein